MRERRRIRLGGRVQGVGYRPFVYRQAARFGLVGWVRNEAGRVVVEAEGEPARLDAFQHALLEEAPAIALPNLVSVKRLPESDDPGGFLIVDSDSRTEADVHVPPDFFACPECLDELFDPGDRRYGYPFINCTQCGPRYTIIRDLPYDRPATSMSGFPLCGPCSEEYSDPGNRRFHAQPLACPDCGPRLHFAAPGRAWVDGEPLDAALDVLRLGGILAAKGVGGYHLMCDPEGTGAVARLRERKHRPHKPLALMIPEVGVDGLDAARRLARFDELEAALMVSPARPVVLLEAVDGSEMVDRVAPGLNELGLMLPYSPLHHLLLRRFARPLVATSGNLSGEPVITDLEEAESRLAGVADGFLHHDRPILRPADDSVYRRAAGVPRPLRFGRGTAPVELSLPLGLSQPVVACGAHMKCTVALAWDDRVVLSPHIGDLDSPRSLRVFGEVVEDLQRLYGVTAEVALCDAHAGYGSHAWALESGLDIVTIHHHYAHASAITAEASTDGSWLVFTWDGVGLGPDGSLWGGETLHGEPGSWRRVATLRPFRLPGGEAASRQPWRSAYGLLWSAGRSTGGIPQSSRALDTACARGLNSPWTSAAGRLFDGFASLAGVIEHASFEGQGPMLLEHAAGGLHATSASLPLRETGELLEADWEPLIDLALSPGPLSRRADVMHRMMANTIGAIAARCAERVEFSVVGLCGGVFQNRLLAESAISELGRLGFDVVMPATLPVNDGAISAGQVLEYAAISRRDRDPGR